MNTTILVPLDGSPLAERALPVAARIARAAGATLHLAHVHVPSTDPISIEGMPVIDEQLRSLAPEHERIYLERAAARVASDGLRTAIARLEGPVVPALTAYAHEIGASLIVMTTHGRGGLLHLWLGSVAESLVRLAGLPLLLLRPDAEGVIWEAPFQRVLVPLDGSLAAEEILPHAAALARADGGELHLLRVVPTLAAPEGMPFRERFQLDEGTEAEELAEAWRYLEAVAARVEGMPVRCKAMTGDDPAAVIVEEAGADLVALTTYGATGRSRGDLGGIASRVLRARAGSLLALRPAGRAAG